MQAGVLPGVLGVGVDSHGMGASSRVTGQDYGDNGGLVGSVSCLQVGAYLGFLS